MCPYICRIDYYEDYTVPYVKRRMNLLVYAKDFDEAVSKVTHYIDNIESINIICVGDELALFEVSDETVEEILDKYNT